jgi:hypothetical protein
MTPQPDRAPHHPSNDTANVADEASGASRLDASKSRCRYSIRHAGTPPEIAWRLFVAECHEVFSIWSEAVVSFPAIDDPDVEFMLSEAWRAYASAHPVSYPRESVYGSWAEEWAGLVWGMQGEGEIDELTRDAVDAWALGFNVPCGPPMPTWWRIIYQLDEMSGRRPTRGGFAAIRPDGDGRWRVPNDGEKKRWCLVIPIWAGGSRLRMGKRRIHCLDLVAIDPGIPDRWRVRTGLVPLLGDLGDLEESYRMNLPVRLARNPLDWLKRGGMTSGCYCVLDWDDIEAQALLTDAYSLIVTADDFAAELHRRINKLTKVNRPRLIIDDAAEGAA